MKWKTGDWAFAESYSVWGWAQQSTNTDCNKDVTLFRLVIDVPEEVPVWKLDLTALGNNALVGRMVNGQF